MVRKSLSLFTALDGFVRSKEAAGKSQYTIRNYRQTVDKVQAYFGEDDPELKTLDRERWEGFMAWLQNEYTTDGGGIAKGRLRPLSPKSVCNVHTDLSSFYSWAISPGVELVDEHLFRYIERPGYELPLIEPFTKDEVEKLLKACDVASPWHNHASVMSLRPTRYRDRAIVHVLLSTGVRAAELCNIRFRDLDMATRTISVAGKGKGRDSKPRHVHFGKTASAALWRYLSELIEGSKPEDYVFMVDINGVPRPMDRNILLRLLRRIGERAGVPDVHPHRFRHTFATEFLRNGGDLLALQRLLGHTTLEMVRVYAHVVSADLERQHARSDPNDNRHLKP